MNIDQWKKADGSYVTPDGKTYDNPKSLLHQGLLGFDNAKAENGVLKFMRLVLRLYKDMPNPVDCAPEDMDKMTQASKDWDHRYWVATGEGGTFVTAWLEKSGLFNRNGGIEGKWLTELGEKFLEDLESIYGKA